MNILILNGSPRRNGKTNRLVESFKKGTEINNHIVEFNLYDMDINGCRGCDACRKGDLCIQKDDMGMVYETFIQSDVVVFASPVYFWTITGTLKSVVDRLYAILSKFGYSEFRKDGVLIMTAGGSDYSRPQIWYRTFETNLGWRNLGEILGADKLDEAEELGRSI